MSTTFRTNTLTSKALTKVFSQKHFSKRFLQTTKLLFFTTLFQNLASKSVRNEIIEIDSIRRLSHDSNYISTTIHTIKSSIDFLKLENSTFKRRRFFKDANRVIDAHLKSFVSKYIIKLFKKVFEQKKDMQ